MPSALCSIPYVKAQRSPVIQTRSGGLPKKVGKTGQLCPVCPSNYRGDLQNLMTILLLTLQIQPPTRLLHSDSGRFFFRELLILYNFITSDDFDPDSIMPLLTTALADDSNDVLIWDEVGCAITESTPPPRPIFPIQEKLWLQNTSSFANSSEYGKDVDVFKE